MASRLLSTRLSSTLRRSILRLPSLSPPPDPRLRPPPPLLLRSLSTAPARRPTSRPRPSVDIGARARQLQNRRLWTYALTFSCVAGFIVVVLSNFQDSLLFYITPTDALEKFQANPAKTRFRLGGLVLEGSVVHPTTTSPAIEFVITDLVTDILVRYEGSLPDLFREGHSVVVEGSLRPLPEEERARAGSPAVSEKAKSGDCFFWGTEVLAKHDEKYMPKEVAVALERNRKKIEADAEAEASKKPDEAVAQAAQP